MAVIIAQRKRLAQPQGRVDVAYDWIEKGLRALVTQTPFDFVTGQFVTALSVPNTSTQHGIALNPIKSAASYMEFPFELSGALSVFALIARDAPVDTSGPGVVAALASNRTAGQGAFWEANLGNGFGSPSDIEKPRFSANYGGIGVIYVNGALVAGNDPGEFVLPRYVFHSLLFTTYVGAPVSGSGATRLFNISSTFGMAARAPIVALFDKGLPQQDAIELYQNPWQLFRPDPARVYSLPSLTPRRALFHENGTIRQATDAMLNLGRKPLVLMPDGVIQTRKGVEGIPLVLEEGRLRTLDPATETLMA